MKRIVCLFVVCFITLIAFSSCRGDNNVPSLRSGEYCAVGDYQEMLTPYLYLDTDQKKFLISAGYVVSYADHGNYEVVDGIIIATSQSRTFQFEIVNKNVLVLIDKGEDEYFETPINTQFVFREDLK